MADIAITAANVAVASGATVESAAGLAGATITAGQTLALDASDGRYKLADADSATASLRSPKGIALHGASNGQPIRVHTKGPITCGGTLVAGTAYYCSKVAGGLAPVADITGTGTYPTIMGIATSTTVLDVLIHESNVSL